MQVALIQYNPTVGAMGANAHSILQWALKAKASHARMAIFPELALCGYPPKDLLFLQSFHRQIQDALVWLAQKTPIPLLLGAPTQNPCQNAVFWCYEGEVKVLGKKQLLPNYGEFNENRYFIPKEGEFENRFLYDGLRFGVLICEDMWDQSEQVISNLLEKPVDIVLGFSASPYEINKIKYRNSLFQNLAKKYQIPLLNVGQVGANDGLIFDGGTIAFNASGQCVGHLPAFEEGMVLLDIKQMALSEIAYPDTQKELSKALCLGIADYVKKTKSKKVIVGLSGGVDSALVATLAQKALGKEKVLGVLMPSSYSSLHSKKDAQVLAQNLGIQSVSIPIEPMVEAYRVALKHLLPCFEKGDLVDQNLQARTRGVLLMALANAYGGLVLCTANKSEIAMGYGTLYGDLIGALAPLGDLYKTQVYELAHAFGAFIPSSTLTKPPSAELYPGQLDTHTLPDYGLLDAFLGEIEMGAPNPQNPLAAQVDGRLCQNAYKRKTAPVILKVSPKAFEVSYFWPSAHDFSYLR